MVEWFELKEICIYDLLQNFDSIECLEKKFCAYKLEHILTFVCMCT